MLSFDAFFGVEGKRHHLAMTKVFLNGISLAMIGDSIIVHMLQTREA